MLIYLYLYYHISTSTELHVIAARATLSKPLMERAKGTKILASVRDIADFAKGTEEDLSKFPSAEHHIIQNHALVMVLCYTWGLHI